MNYSCNVCHQSYLRKSSLDKHKILCDFKHQSKREIAVEAQESGDIPTHLQLVKIVQELVSKLNDMEAKMVHMHKWVERRKQKINVLQWLNSQTTPSVNWETWITTIQVQSSDVRHLLENTVNDTIGQIIIRCVELAPDSVPVKAFTQKNGLLYIVDNAFMWKVMESADLVKLTKHIQTALFRELDEWRENNHLEDMQLFIKINKAIIKTTSITQSADGVMHKVKNAIYMHLKTDLQLMVQLDFE